MVIDDEASIRESVEMFLREKGLSVHTAGTGAEGIEAWLKYQPQVIILDIRLPDTSGLEVLKQITGLQFRREGDNDHRVPRHGNDYRGDA